MKKKLIVLAALVLFCFSTFAQTRHNAAPYNNGIGATIGFMNGVTFKTFPTNNLAIQLDLGYRFHSYAPAIFSFNPNLMYQGAIKNGFYWFVGGGLNVGATLPRYDYLAGYRYVTQPADFVFGVNAIGGVEYKFPNIPLALQADVRPGFFLFSNHKYHDPYLAFDYNFINVSARYTF